VAWDASRPVPYKRLVKEWLIYAGIMAAIFLLVLRDSTSTPGLLIGLGDLVVRLVRSGRR